MAAQGSGTRTRVTLTGLNRNTADFRVILIDIGQGFYFPGLHSPISASIKVKNGNFCPKIWPRGYKFNFKSN